MTDRPAPPPPPAAGRRVPFDALPADLRAAIDERFGAPVVDAQSQAGGFSPGVASRVVLADGRQAFVKAVHPSANAQAPDLHRREGAVLAALPAETPVPRWQWTLDQGPDGWVVLAIDDVAGRQPAVPWHAEELDRVLAAIEALAARLSPSPIDPAWLGQAGDLIADAERGWATVDTAERAHLDDWTQRHLDTLVALESGVRDAARGDTLLHQDLRADNLLLTDTGVVVVDWPHARVGQPWIDLLWFAPSVAMQGGPDPETLLRRSASAQGADPDAIDAVLAAIAGFFTLGSLLPAPPGLPTLRVFQAAQGDIARRWLARRRGLR
jgi:aminoglycoside phosphotransferase (APT) family kinase protein